MPPRKKARKRTRTSQLKKFQPQNADFVELETGAKVALPGFADSGSIKEQVEASSRLGFDANFSSNNLVGQLYNVANGINPFISCQNNSVSAKDAIELCQLAYWNISELRIVVDIMTEFSNSSLYFEGGTGSSRSFFEEWYKKIGGWKHRQQFFLEYFRSGNVLYYKINAQLDKFKFQRKYSREPKSTRLPVRYVLLNPVDIRYMGSIDFSTPFYGKVLTPYEVERLKRADSETERAIYDGLPADVKKQIDSSGGIVSTEVVMPLNVEDIVAVFYKKQDYEPMAIPVYFPVLRDINLKLEFKKIDNIIARTTDHIVLLVTMGTEEGCREGLYEPLITATRQAFQFESVGRVFVSDYTTKMEFIVPDLNKILGKDKYEVVNADIANGLMNIFFSDDKFANSMMKVKVFLERLREARSAYIEYFLKPEMERIGKDLGFVGLPEPKFEEVDLKDEVQYMKLYNQLYQLGLLTPAEIIEAYNTGVLPTPEKSIENQKKFLEQKDNDLYEPIMSPSRFAEEEVGRPKGETAPQTTKNVGPIGTGDSDSGGGSTADASAENPLFSINQFKENIAEAQRLITSVAEEYKKSNKIQRISKKKMPTVYSIATQILVHESKDNWNKLIKKYVAGNIPLDSDQSHKVSEVACKHQVDDLTAALMFHSKLSSEE